MTVDRQARTTLQKAIVGYMSGSIRAFAFEDQYEPCRTSPDKSVQDIVRQVWSIHDEFIDHPISVTEQGWEALRRTVAFLGTDLEVTANQNAASWPFNDETAWSTNQHLVNEIELPEYDPEVHGRPSIPWWNRIPTVVGLAIIVAGVVLLVAIVGAVLRWQGAKSTVRPYPPAALTIATMPALIGSRSVGHASMTDRKATSSRVIIGR